MSNPTLRWVCVLLATASLLLALSAGHTPKADAQDGGIPAIPMVSVVAASFDGDVRDLPHVPSKPKLELDLHAPRDSKQPSGPASEPSPNLALAPMPSPVQNFAGLSHDDSVMGGTAGAGWPPDTNGDVGLNHYIQAVNDAYAIYDKSGTLLAAFTENSLFSNAGSNPCNGDSFGDPVVVYDQFADRWILTNFAFAVDANRTPLSPFYQCFAASKTGDPVTGGWWLYAVRMDTGTAGQPPTNTLNDYGKFGPWNDGCPYMSANGFLMPSGSYNGAVFAAFNRSDMESGAALRGALGFIATTIDPFTLIPSNISGAKLASSLPASGTPAYFVSESQTAFNIEVRKFTPGANCTGGSLSAATNVSQASYGFALGIVVPQPNTTNLLDSLDARIMQKVQYRRVGSAESLWVVHTTRDAGATARPQWAQLDVSGGTVATTPVQQQIFAPDTTLFRWMGSIAADHNGNVALGYSTSNGTSPNFPSLAYAGRLVGDPVNTLPQLEVQLVAGGGSQTNNCGGKSCHRWGDYSAMSVDPADDCTFWYTNEYYDSQTSGTSGNWHTRIGSFKFPTCSAPALSVTSSSPTVLGSATAFTATLTNGAGFTFTWDFGDGATASGANVSHTYNAAGLYTASVTATMDIDRLTARTSVSVNETITGLNASNTSPTALGSATAFTATIATGTNVSYLWNFGDGVTGSGANTTHSYSGVGTYRAIVTATNSVNSLTATTPVTMTDVAITGLTAANSSPTPLGSPTTLTATVSSGTNITYAWNFGDGQTGSGANVSHTYASIGTYTATVTATNSSNLLTETTIVTVNPPNVTLTVSKAGTGSGTVTSTPSGVNCGSTCSASFSAGTGVTLTVLANTASSFSGWSGACSGTGNCVMTLSVSTTVTATFNTYSVYVPLILR